MMFLDSIKNKGTAFIIFWMLAIFLICIPINIFFQPKVTDILNIPLTRERKIEKSCIGITGIICFDNEHSQTETISNVPIIYITMFGIELSAAFCLGCSLWLLNNKKSEIKT